MKCDLQVDLVDFGFELCSPSLDSILDFGLSCEGRGMCFRPFRLI